MQDMARYARRVRRRLGLTQIEFARRIDVSHETIRNWEQGKRGPTGAARALLRGSRQGARDGPAGAYLRPDTRECPLLAESSRSLGRIWLN